MLLTESVLYGMQEPTLGTAYLVGQASTLVCPSCLHACAAPRLLLAQTPLQALLPFAPQLQQQAHDILAASCLCAVLSTVCMTWSAPHKGAQLAFQANLPCDPDSTAISSAGSNAHVPSAAADSSTCRR